MNIDNFEISKQGGGSFSMTPVAIGEGAKLSSEHPF